MLVIICSSCRANYLGKTNSSTGLTYDKEIIALSKDIAITDTLNHSFQQFWKTFRRAVIEGNIIEIIKYTKFPLKTRRPLDTDPIVKYHKRDFIRLFQIYLNHVSGMGITHETQFDVIKKVEFINGTEDRYYIVIDRWARVGDIEFRLCGKEWKMDLIYLDNDIE